MSEPLVKSEVAIATGASIRTAHKAVRKRL